jgi:hypothetical protein
MPRFIWFLAFTLLASATGPLASAAPEVSIVSTFPSEGYYSPQFKECEGETEDALTLTVSDHGKRIASKNFCSSYGKATARVVTEKFGEGVIVLNFSEGRGSNAWTDYLELDQLPDLTEILRIPLSWATSGTGRFTYSYVIELPPSGNIRIHLSGQNQQAPDPGPICCIPEARSLTIDVP